MADRAVRCLWLVLVGALLALAPRPSGAAIDDPLDLRYAMYWGGLHIADLRLVYDVGPGAYSSELKLETVGLAEWLARYRGEARIEGERSNPHGLLPKKYTYRQKSKRVSRTADVLFDPETGAALEAASTKRGRSQEIEVPEELWVDVVDPLTAFLRLREDIAALKPGESATVQVFDGRRRYDLHATLTGRGKTEVKGRRVPVLEVDLAMKPLAGFDEDDRETWRVRVLVSDDEALVPIELRTLDGAFAGVVRLRAGYEAETG